MNFYELSDLAKSLLTEEELQNYILIECMEKGIENPKEPVLLTVPPKPELKAAGTLFEVKPERYGSSFHVSTKEAIEQLLKIPVASLDATYISGDYYKTFDGTQEAFSFSEVPYYTKEEIQKNKEALSKHLAYEKMNQDILSAYNKAIKDRETLLEDFYSNLRDARDSVNNAKALLSIWNEYLKIAGSVENAQPFFKNICDKKGYDPETCFEILEIPVPWAVKEDQNDRSQ